MGATTDEFEKISLIQMDGDQTPIVIASDVLAITNKITVDLPKDLVPSNDCKSLCSINISFHSIQFRLSDVG